MGTFGFGSLSKIIHENDLFVFGEDVVYEPKSGGSFSIIGIYNDIYEAVDPDTERVLSSNDPTLGIRLSDLSNPPEKGDIVRLTSRGLVFRVAESREDGEGMSELQLNRVPQ